MLACYIGISGVLLIILFNAGAYVDPWVSSKRIGRFFIANIHDNNGPILVSKILARGVYCFTDQKVAVIDVSGNGFFSPHPIPRFDTEQKVIDFFAQRPISYGILEYDHVLDVKRILKDRPYRVDEIKDIGGQWVIRVERI